MQKPAVEKFAHLFNNHNREGNDRREDPVRKAKRRGLEELIHDRRIHRKELKKNDDDSCIYQEFI